MPGHYGLFRGIVVENVDPEGGGRIRCRCPQIMGDGVQAPLGWAINPFATMAGDGLSGTFITPKVGSTVILAFVDGDEDFPVYMGSYPNVSGTNPNYTAKVPQPLGSQSAVEIEGVSVPGYDPGEVSGPDTARHVSPSGHRLEMEEGGSLGARHRSGSFIQFGSIGELVVRVIASFLIYVAEHLKVGVGGNITLASGGVVNLGSAAATRGVARLDDTVGLSGFLTGSNAGGPVVFSFTAEAPNVPGAGVILNFGSVPGKITSASNKVRSV